MIGLGIGIKDAAEFNRRALIALRGVKTTSQFLKDMLAGIANGAALTTKQQQAFYNTVHAHRRQIVDELVKDYAATHARGAD